MARRKWTDDDYEAREAEEAAPAEPCWLCTRPLGSEVVAHHPVPKSRGGRGTVNLHPICHHTLHASFTNAELARIGEAVETLRTSSALAQFLEWIAGKDPDFHVPTTKRGGDPRRRGR